MTSENKQTMVIASPALQPAITAGARNGLLQASNNAGKQSAFGVDLSIVASTPFMMLQPSKNAQFA